MKRLLWFMIIGLFAVPLQAQDAGDLGGFSLDIPAPTGNAPGRGAAPARGGAPARGAAPAGRGAQPAGTPIDRLVRMRELLKESNVPLTMEQESSLNAILDAEVPAMRQRLQARILELQRAKAASQPPAATTTQPSGARGLPPAAMPSPDELTPEYNRLNDELLGKLASAPTLKVEQQTILKKLQKDQIKSRGGFDALSLTMADAGVPFTDQQSAQIQALFDQQNEARLQLARESQGGVADPAKASQLERSTLGKVLQLLSPPQRTALAAAPPKPPQ